MEALKVFISSVMDRDQEDLLAEREVVRRAIDALDPLARSWMFEDSPAQSKPVERAYLDEVESSDILLLVVGRVLTAATRSEYETARRAGKAILMFAKEVLEREPLARELVSSPENTWKSFTTANDLEPKVRQAVLFEALRRIKGAVGEPIGSSDKLTILTTFARNHIHVRIEPLIPLIPEPRYDLFTVREYRGTTIDFEKQSPQQLVAVPAQRIEDVLMYEPTESPTILLDGRIQWLTLVERWRFFAEKPDRSEGLQIGFPKDAGRQDRYVMEIVGELTKRGYHVGWSRRDHLTERLNARTHEIFYDDNGRYLCNRGPDVDSILTTRADG